MNVLALEPYYGGSHRAFLDGWVARSRHTWTILGLPAYKWKWRMRHSAITFADDVKARLAAGPQWDVVWCSDMLNLAELLGLLPTAVAQLPRIVYFHENQLTYGDVIAEERDYHFAFTNLTSALAADTVWFNSDFHRRSFLDGMRGLMRRMPDHQPLDAIQRVADRSEVQAPGIDSFPKREPRRAGPLRILWAARWELDKDPDTYFAALVRLQDKGVEFRLSVLGESFETAPPVFAQARRQLSDAVDHWGYLESRQEYRRVLSESDVIVSTARHEFFGIAVAEAIAAGAVPLVPNRLAYPELLDVPEPVDNPWFHDDSVAGIADRLAEWAAVIRDRGSLHHLSTGAINRFAWDRRAPELDAALSLAVGRNKSLDSPCASEAQFRHNNNPD